MNNNFIILLTILLIKIVTSASINNASNENSVNSPNTSQWAKKNYTINSNRGKQLFKVRRNCPSGTYYVEDIQNCVEPF